MLRLTLLVTAFLLAACSRREKVYSSVDTISVDTISVDTLLVFSSTASAALPDSIKAVLQAYAEGRITADAAAKVVVAHLLSGGGPLNVQLDAPLRDAIGREFKRRNR
jgi:hypothetical protein